MGYWKFYKNAAATNLMPNPSIESAITGWTTGGTNTIAKSSAQSFRGNYSALVTYSNSTTLAGYAMTLTAVRYYMTVWVYLASDWDGGAVSLSQSGFTSATTNTASNSVSTLETWTQLAMSFTPDAGDLSGNVGLITAGAPTVGRTIHFDAFQIETTQQTSYIDGEQPGCYWNGARHLSTSTREAISREGGILKDFDDDYSLPVEKTTGTGMPPIANITVGRALLPGAEHQRAKTGERIFSLMQTATGSNQNNYHSIRQALINAIGPNVVPGDQPVILEYSGAAVTKRIRAHYEGGLNVATQSGFAEQFGLQWRASEPYFYGLPEEKVNVGPTSATARTIIGRQRGTWSVFGPPANTTASYGAVEDILVVNDSNIYVCGAFTDWDDVAAADNIVQWNGSAWAAVGTPSAGTASITIINDMAYAPDGTLYVVGNFTDFANVAAADYIAQWDGSNWTAVGTPNTGAASFTSINSCAIGTDGNLYVGGAFQNLADIANADNVAYWDGSAWNAMSTGANGTVNSVVAGFDGNIYIGGAFTTAGGTTVNRVSYWNGSAFVAMSTGFDSTVTSLLATTDGRVFAGGVFTQDGSAAQNLTRIAEWTGKWKQLGTGVSGGQVDSLSMDSNGLLYVGGQFTSAGSLTTANRMAIWDGSSWRPAPVDLPGSPEVSAIATANEDDVYLGFNTEGTAYFPSPVTATNNGTAPAYPIITIRRDGGTGTLSLEEITNITTGKSLFFDIDLLDGEEITIDLRPGRRSMTTNYRGGINSAGERQSWRLLPSSDITDFFLIPGDNSIACYTSPAAPAELSVFVRWFDTFESAD